LTDPLHELEEEEDSNPPSVRSVELDQSKKDYLQQNFEEFWEDLALEHLKIEYVNKKTIPSLRHVQKASLDQNFGITIYSKLS